MKKRVGTLNVRPAKGVVFEHALVQFEEARDAYSWRGGAAPEARGEIVERYLRKRKALTDYVVALEDETR